MPEQTVSQLAVAFAILSLWGALIVFIIVRAALLRSAFRCWWRRGLGLALVCLGLVLPGEILKLAHMDLAGLFSDRGTPMPEFLRSPIVTALVGVFTLFILLVQVVWNTIVYCVAAAEWELLGRPAFPRLSGQGRPTAGPYLALALVGAAAGCLSALAFHYGQVDVGDMVKQMQKLFPGMEAVHRGLQVPIWLLAFAAPAILEECVFRGALLGFLLRHLRRPALAIAATSLLWALLHLGNTDAPLWKFAQIFVMGLILGAAARRYSVEVAIAGHLGLNVAAVCAGYLLV